MHHDAPVIIVGGGLAGLSCARSLTDASRPFLLLEREDQFGGRVRTDSVDHFRLDRGFQVLQTAYPEALKQLDYSSLNLKSYLPGALIRKNSRFHRFIDLWRRPWDGLVSGIRSGIGTFADRLRIAKLRSRCRSGKIAELFDRSDQSTREYLASMGFSEDMIVSFFRPFLGGIFLERQLATSCRMMMFVFRMFSEGDAAVPAEGMQAIPNQMASRLHPPQREHRDQDSPAGDFASGYALLDSSGGKNIYWS